jgi:uncharacterized protein
MSSIADHSEHTVTEQAQPRVTAPAAALADPAPIGLAGFAMTTFLLSWVNAGLASEAVAAAVLPLALFYGGLVQLLAGMWEVRKGNTFGALAFSSYGAFWLSFAAYVKFVAPGLGANAGTATGMFLLVWAIFTGYLTVAALRTSVAVLAVLATLFVTYVLLTVGALSGAGAWTMVGGWVGLITAVLAWYASFAGVTNSTFGRTVLPMMPLSER